MKCKHCDGVGFFENGASQFKCVYCDGTGEVEQTNEEHIRSCSFNELARVLYCMIINGERIRPDLGYIKRWLKEIHQ